MAIAVAGCGGSDDSTSSETLTKKQYISQADAICKKANDRQEVLLTKEGQERTGTGNPSKSEQTDFVLNSGLPPLKDEAAALAELGAPAGEEEKAEAFVDALEKAIDEIEAEPLAFAEGKNNAFVPVEQLGGKIGFEICGGP